MRIAVGADHAGYPLKAVVVGHLGDIGHEVVDVGTDSTESTDYPRYGEAAARMVSGGEADRAVVICGSGIGMAMVANKLPGVRAVHAHNGEEAMMSRLHNDANVLALAGSHLSKTAAAGMIERFLETDFEGGEHGDRLALIAAMERGEAL